MSSTTDRSDDRMAVAMELSHLVSDLVAADLDKAADRQRLNEIAGEIINAGHAVFALAEAA